MNRAAHGTSVAVAAMLLGLLCLAGPIDQVAAEDPPELPVIPPGLKDFPSAATDPKSQPADEKPDSDAPSAVEKGDGEPQAEKLSAKKWTVLFNAGRRNTA